MQVLNIATFNNNYCKGEIKNEIIFTQKMVKKQYMCKWKT